MRSDSGKQSAGSRCGMVIAIDDLRELVAWKESVPASRRDAVRGDDEGP